MDSRNPIWSKVASMRQSLFWLRFRSGRCGTMDSPRFKIPNQSHPLQTWIPGFQSHCFCVVKNELATQKYLRFKKSPGNTGTTIPPLGFPTIYLSYLYYILHIYIYYHIYIYIYMYYNIYICICIIIYIWLHHVIWYDIPFFTAISCVQIWKMSRHVQTPHKFGAQACHYWSRFAGTPICFF